MPTNIAFLSSLSIYSDPSNLLKVLEGFSLISVTQVFLSSLSSLSKLLLRYPENIFTFLETQ